MDNIWITGAARTPIGSHGGALSTLSATCLGSISVKETLARAKVSPDEVDEVIFGNVLSAGLGQNIARQVSIGAGIPDSVPATSVNKVCGSGLKSVMLATQAIQCKDADIVVSGGTESMTRAPHVTPTVLNPRRSPEGEPLDVMLRDGLWDVYNDVHMGTCGDRCAERYGLSRRDQDDFAVESYKRALAAQESGHFAREITPVATQSAVFVNDEEPARFNEEKLRNLRPAFGKTGTVSAGNASSINDGAASVVVMSDSARKLSDTTPAARVVGYAIAAREPEWFTLAPITAIRRLLQKTGHSVGDVDLFEINEAFSCVPMAAIKELSIPQDRVNAFGGAVALGHPIGASGCRILVTLLNAMEVRSAKLGIASLCIGGGEAIALAVERT
ncbi:MAG: thiolase family protein [Candidatus Latescibacterota bacterium]|nr:thiolase family protein [Candidatus Latescibacterota bacterium]